MKVYLAGPMRGYPEYNFPAFHYAANTLRNEGHEVFSPAEKGEEVGYVELPESSIGADEGLAFRRKVFKLDLSWICEHADAVALMAGWENSKGAQAERAAAEAVGLTVIELGSRYVLPGSTR